MEVRTKIKQNIFNHNRGWYQAQLEGSYLKFLSTNTMFLLQTTPTLMATRNCRIVDLKKLISCTFQYEILADKPGLSQINIAHQVELTLVLNNFQLLVSKPLRKYRRYTTLAIIDSFQSPILIEHMHLAFSIWVLLVYTQHPQYYYEQFSFPSLLLNVHSIQTNTHTYTHTQQKNHNAIRKLFILNNNITTTYSSRNQEKLFQIIIPLAKQCMGQTN